MDIVLTVITIFPTVLGISAKIVLKNDGYNLFCLQKLSGGYVDVLADLTEQQR